jgi:hypothetical protein
VISIFDALVKAADARGWLQPARNPVGRHVAVFGEHAFFAFEEVIRRRKHQPTEDEKRLITAAQARQRRGAWSAVSELEIPYWDFVPMGDLTLTLESPFAYGVKRRVGDKIGERLESRLNALFSGLIERCVVARLHREKLEAESQRLIAAEHSLLEAAYRKREEAKRWEALCKDANAWEQAERIRRFLHALESRRGTNETYEGLEVADFLAWARHRADRLDPLSPLAKEEDEEP